jgi:hypothetical protein
MFTRLGSQPSPAWIGKIRHVLARPRQVHKARMPFWAFFLLARLAILLLAPFLTAMAFSKVHNYAWFPPVAGEPQICSASAAPRVIAWEGRATGFLAAGAIAAGYLVFGGLAVDVVSVGELYAGLLRIGGVALGWRRSGGLAVGRAALGGLAVGRYAYTGNGLPYGEWQAGGRQKERLIG